ncbi:carbohydrate kinase family protein [Kiloniella sp. b19]|uniref:carbohydrate kinase family protein n=1 Tax=Kiloniella sp. GXU_MW_B19 TaxID=3141326 RepID=UPI0031D45AA0
MADKQLLAIGAAHWDVQQKSINPVVMASSNPVACSRSMGGVARNVACDLGRLGHQAGLMSLWGDDLPGDELQSSLQEQGLSLVPVARHGALPTASYTAVLDCDGELLVGLADMAIYDAFVPSSFVPHLMEMQRYSHWFVDANLPEESLSYLARQAPEKVFVAADCVSVAKCHRLVDLLPRVDLLFCNEAEIRALLKEGYDVGLETLGPRLLERFSVKAAVVSDGARGAWIFTGKKNPHHVPAVHVEKDYIVDVTGAGDAMIAGTLCGLLRGLELVDAVQRGMNASALCLQYRGASPAEMELMA